MQSKTFKKLIGLHEARKKECEPRKKESKNESFKKRKKGDSFNTEKRRYLDKWLEVQMEEMIKHGQAVIQREKKIQKRPTFPCGRFFSNGAQQRAVEGAPRHQMTN